MKRSANVYLLLAIGGSLAALALMAVGRLAPLPALGELGVAAVAMAVALLAVKSCVDWWRTSDEAVREAHKFAWYWGGSVGMGVAAGAAVVLQHADYRLDALGLFPGENGLFAAGVLACIVCQTVGYAVAWAGWWLVRR